MGILDSAFDSFEGMLADQWKDIVTSAPFDEHTVVAPGIRKREQSGFGANRGSDDILSTGSIIFIPENTAAFIFSQSGIEQVITEPGGYEYRDGEANVFDEQSRKSKGIGKILLDEAGERFGFSGMSAEEQRVAFVNLREIRNIKFGTRGPLVYNDSYYQCDLEIFSYGSFTVKVTDPVLFVRNFVPAGVVSYSFNDPAVRSQMLTEFLHSFIVAVGELSSQYRVSMLPSQADEIRGRIVEDTANAGTWAARFGLELVSVGIENIELSEQSRALIQQFAEQRMSVRAYEDVSQTAANIAAQQMIAQGVRDNGLGDAGGMLFGMNLASGLNPVNASQAGAMLSGAPEASAPQDGQPGDQTAPDDFASQLELLEKLKGLMDAGVVTEEEFAAKKRQILGI